jgi:MFS family permease
MSGILGAVLGVTFGLCGGILGILAGKFSRRGRHKKLVMSFIFVMIVLGVLSLCIGLFALLMGQPYHVWYPFILLGVILVAVLVPNYVVIKNIYARAELNSFSSRDNTPSI